MINQGVSFGLAVPVWLTYLGLGAVVWLLVWDHIRLKRTWQGAGLWLILAGGVMNMVSRVKYGGVVDNWSLLWLSNNLADYLISIGLIIYIVLIVADNRKTRKIR